ncbi:hypothetical protein Pfo_002764 [Paulownia fortunei]|nr:hypothetical protein Pfo_002764 [Paulownia fortunei]
MSSSSPEESPPSDSDSSSNSPPPPSSSSSSPPPPDSSDSGSPSSSPPPPKDDSPSPPPPSNDNSSSAPPQSQGNSPPPPSKDNSPSPPPPSDSNDNSSSSPPPDKSPSPPPSDKKSPPSNSSGNDDRNNKSPPPPKSEGSSKGNSPSPPPPPSHSGSVPSSRGTSPPLSDSSSNNDNSSANQSSIIAGAAAGAGLLLLIMIVFMVSCARRKKRKGRDEMKYYRDNSHGNMSISSELSSAGFSGPHQAALPPPHPAVALGFNQSSFTYEDLAAATGGFAQSNLLGQGGFGYVHKGVLPNGKEIAVKSLKSNSGQGEREFQAEVDIISRVHHRHLVSLVGYCIAGSQRMLVYEYVPNGTLEYHLHGAGRPTMDWPTRLKIALGSAKGFAYLHEDCHPRIIHRDIKAANILLDLNFEAKVADFGLAKLSSDNYTHVSTRIMGTFGYMAPEYASSGKLTEKSDIYSFGIMLLELITGRRPIDISSDDDGLVDWARPILVRVTEGESYEELVDPRLGNNYDHQEMLRMVASAGACIRHSARRRPKMSQIVRALEGDVSLDDLNEGVKTAQIAMFGSSGGSEHDLRRLGKGGATTSQEFTSSDDGLTGEFVRTSGGNSQEMRSNQGGRTRSP